jgi:hypothetical protein
VEPLGARDRAANDILSAFDFDAAPREPVLLSADRDPPALPDTRSAVVYACYGAALLVPPSIGLLIRARARRRRVAGS